METQIDWNAQFERNKEIKAKRGLRPENGTILEMTKLKEIQEFTDEYDDQKGGVRKVIRFKYLFSDKTLIVPQTLHGKVTKIMKLSSVRPDRIQVIKEGQGINTRYDAVAM